MRIDAHGLNTMHDDIIGHTFLTQYLALESTGDEVHNRQHLLVRRVSAHRIGIRHVEIHTRTFEGSQIAIETVRNNKDTIDLTLLHRIACLCVVIGNELDIHRGRSLHLMREATGDRGLIHIHQRHRHLLRSTGLHQRHEEEQGEQECSH